MDKRVLLRFRPLPIPMGPEIQAIRSKAHKFRRLSNTVAVTVDEKELQQVLDHPAIEIFPDVQLQPFGTPIQQMSPSIGAPGLPEVLQKISAPNAWPNSRGEDTYIAIVDTGISGQMLEFPTWKKADGWSYDGSDPWEDYYGHGSMCAP